nr:hypothetical protein [Tanacetum cinerariifolium]
MENGTTWPKTHVVEGVTTMLPITTVEEKAQRRLVVKARSTLTICIPNEHYLKFNSIKDAKQLLEAIKEIWAKKFLKRTERKLAMNGNETNNFDKFNVECYNCHKREHFARECRALKNQDNKHKESTRRIVHMETYASITLVSCDGLGGYD